MNTELLLPVAVDLFVKSALVVLIALMALLVWRQASAAQRGCVWGLVFAVILFLPVTRLVAPHWVFTFPQPPVVTNPTPTPRPQLTVKADESVADLLAQSPRQTIAWPVLSPATTALSIWIAGMLMLVTYRMVGSFLLHRCHRASTPLEDGDVRTAADAVASTYGISRSIDLRLSEDCRVPVTWGTLRPIVMLPVESLNWSQGWLESALRHELGHVKNLDHLKRWMTFLACAVYWPNPLVWLAAKQFHLAQEEASDNLVLGVGVSSQEYATQLVEAIRVTTRRRALSLPVVAMARRATLEGRLAAILDETRNRQSSGRRLTMTATGVAAIMGIALSAAQLRAVDTSEPEGGITKSPQFVLAFEAAVNALVVPPLDLKHTYPNEMMSALCDAVTKANPQGIRLLLMSPGPFDTKKVDVKSEGGSLQTAVASIAKQLGLQFSITPHYAYTASTDQSDLRLQPHLESILCTYWHGTDNQISREVTLSDKTVDILQLKPGPDGDVSESLKKWGLNFTSGNFATCKPIKEQPGQNMLSINTTADQFAQLHNLLMAAAPEDWADKNHPPTTIVAVPPPPVNPHGTDLERKLQGIILSLDFNNATIAEATNFLAIESKRLDPDHKGVNFVIDPDATSSAKSISISLQNVTLGTALHYVSELANVSFKEGADDTIRIVSNTGNPDNSDTKVAAQPSDKETQATKGKLESIVIDHVDFNQLDVAMILKYLASKSKDLDPDKNGINFVLGNVSPTDKVHREVSVTLDNVSLSELLGYIDQQTNLQYSVEGNTVFLRPAGQAAPPPAVAAPAPAASVQTSPAQEKLTQKVNTLIIPEIDLKQTTIRDAVQFLQQQSKAVDPDHQGVNFILRLPASPATFDLKMENKSVKDILDAVATQAKLEYQIEDYAVYFHPPPGTSDSLNVRTFQVPPNFFVGPKFMVTSPAPPDGTPATGIDVKQELVDRGIEFPSGAAAVFIPNPAGPASFGKLVMRDTPEQLDLVVNLLDLMVRSNKPVDVRQ